MKLKVPHDLSEEISAATDATVREVSAYVEKFLLDHIVRDDERKNPATQEEVVTLVALGAGLASAMMVKSVMAGLDPRVVLEEDADGDDVA